jgi:hypothetical protein
MDLTQFDDLISFARVSRKVTVAGHEISLVTLNSGAYNEAAGRIPTDLPDQVRMERVQREMVAAAISTIDGKSLDQETKVAILTKGQLGLSNFLYDQYIDMIGEQGKTLEDAKKNSSAALSGTSASPKAPALK